jgi:type I restriction enzyme S subunit
MAAQTTTEWEMVQLGSLCDKTSSVNPATNPEKPFTYIDVSSVSNETLKIENSVVLLGKDAPSRARKQVKRGDVIFATVRPTLKRIARITEEFDNQICSTGYCVVRPNHNKADSDFIYFSLSTKEVMNYVQNIQRGVSYPAISDKNLLDISIALPTLPEQKAIAQTLTIVQNTVVEQEKLITKLKELKRSMMQHLFTHGTKGEKTKMTEIGEVPESWDEVEIGSLGQIVTGSTPSTKIDRYYSPQEIDFISPGDISYGKYIYSTEKHISKAGFAVSRPVPKDAICCVCIGSSIGKVAKSYRESTSNQQVNTIICNDNYDSDFVYYLMSFYSDMWRSHATFGPVPLLSKGSFSKINIPVSADLLEQKKIAKMLTAIEDSIEVIEAKHTTYQSLFKTLLHELMSGERRIKLGTDSI